MRGLIGAAICLLAAAPARAGAAEVRAPASPRAPRRYRLAVLGLGSRGVRADDFASVGGALELVREGRWLAGGGLAWQHGLTIARGRGAPISADLVRARAFGG